MGVTRLSLGVEHFDDRILELNGRAHRSAEIFRAYEFARSIDFPQINIDLIAGMLGETDEKWQDAVRRTVALDPDSVTIYQMELPFNTTISSDRLKGEGQFQETVAPWATKRRWVDEAFAALERAGYTVGSAYTAVKRPGRTSFVYRDRLWQGADLAGLGVASFGHVNGVHMQNLDSWGAYTQAIQEGTHSPEPGLPADRRGTPDPRARAAAQARLDPTFLLSGEVRGGRPDSLHRPVRVTCRRRLPGRVVAGAGPAVARGPAARGQPAAAVLPAGAHRHPVHVGMTSRRTASLPDRDEVPGRNPRIDVSVVAAHERLERDLEKLGVDVDVRPSCNIEPPFGRRPIRLHDHGRALTRNS